MNDNKSFVFYESWANFIDMQDRETAKELVYQIYRAGMEKDLDTDNQFIIGIIKSFILPNIEGAKRKYKIAVDNGSKGGRPPKTDAEMDKQIYQMHKDGMTYKEISNQLSLSTNTIGDRVRKQKEKEKELKTKNQNINPETESNNKTFKPKDKSIYNNDNNSDNNSNNPLHYNF